jgi:hypothetical protein
MAEQLADGLWHWSLGQALGRSVSPGLAWWWAEPALPGQARRTFLSRGLPSGHDFNALMGPAGAEASGADPHATRIRQTPSDPAAERESAFRPDDRGDHSHTEPIAAIDIDQAMPGTPGVNPLADLLGHTAPSAPIDFMPPPEPR